MYWELVFVPASGERNSPQNYIDQDIDNQRERATIYSHLESIVYVKNIFQNKNIKPVDNMNQWTIGNYRLYFIIQERKLIFFYICRKRGQKMLKKDKAAARRILENYVYK